VWRGYTRISAAMRHDNFGDCAIRAIHVKAAGPRENAVETILDSAHKVVQASQTFWEVIMKGKKGFTSLATASLGLLIVGGQMSQLRATSSTNFVSHSFAALSQPGDESNVNTFTGKIVSQNGDRYILRDEANDVWYHLDDQQQAGKFFGKSVVVTGTLDGRADMIHIRNIMESKS
jgi:uncharacterized protein YdeI (BOF family)